MERNDVRRKGGEEQLGCVPKRNKIGQGGEGRKLGIIEPGGISWLKIINGSSMKEHGHDHVQKRSGSERENVSTN